MSRGDVLLLSCYELGHQPLTLAWPLAFLRDAGIEATAVDLQVEPFPVAAARAARFVAISVPMHTALRLGVAAAKRIRRQNPKARIAFFGHYAHLNADFLLQGAADAVLSGESDALLVDLSRAALEGVPFEAVTGVSTASRRAAPALGRLQLPAPERSTLPAISRYARFVQDGRSVLSAYTEASRGCKHLCRHCPIVPIYGGRFFAVPVETVMADVRAQLAMGARHVTFGDPDFLNGPTHALRVARALLAEFPELSFDFTAKVEHLLAKKDVVKELKELGAAFVVSAVESLSDDVLRRLRKGHTAADVVRLVEFLDEIGLALQPTLVAFTPWTTPSDYLDTLEFFHARGLAAHVPPVQLSIRLLVPPGSALLDDPESAPFFGPLDAAEFAHPWSHRDPLMNVLAEEVTALVADAETRGEPAEATWRRVRAAAYRATDRGVPETATARRPDPPRLSEQWFCCAEPTRLQVGLVDGV